MNTRDAVLAFLEERRGQCCSGEEIAGQLQISRNAVWKAIRRLREEGYEISAAPKRGYLLARESDVLTRQGIAPYLPGSVSPEQLEIFGEVISTNRTAEARAVEGAPHGTVIIADSQNGGRGRRGHTFYSPPGGIYVSFILRPESFPFSDPRTVTAYAAVCAAEIIGEVTGKKARVKPVNDIFIGDRKVCGILTESVSDMEEGTLSWIVAGIGINYRLDGRALPEDLRDRAGALFLPGEHTVPRNEVLGRLIGRVLTGYRGRTGEEVADEYLRYTREGGRISSSARI